MTLSLLCITKNEPHAAEFLRALRGVANRLGAEFVVVSDGFSTITARNLADEYLVVESNGSIESVLDEAVAACSGDYILRIDDDEKISAEMIVWLDTSEYTQSDVWSFPRRHLWGDGYLTNAPLYPDLQTRLTTKAKAGGRKQVHDGSPYGAGQVASRHILHHKFLIKDYQKRKELAEKYDQLRPGAGTGQWLPFNLPEEAFENLEVAAV